MMLGKNYILLLCAMLLCSQGWACSCGQLSVEKKFEEYSTIIEARVIGVRFKTQLVKVGNEYQAKGLQYKVRIQKRYKGDVKKTIKIFTLRDEAACGTRLSLRGVYLIYAFKNDWGLETDLCSHNISSKDSEFNEIKAMIEKLAAS